MRSLTLTIVFFFSGIFSAGAQDSLGILHGPVQWEQLMEYAWFKEKCHDYKADPAVKTELESLLLKDDTEIIIYGGTWCSDTQYLLPQLYAVFSQEVRKKVRLIMLGRDKQGMDADKWKVTAVPVVIILRGGIELGRITETVQVSPEADLLKIIKGAK